MPNNITQTEADVFLPEVWSKEIIKATNPRFVLANLAWRFDKDAKLGDTIHVPSLTNLVALDKVANLEVSFQSPTETNVNITIDQHPYVAFNVEDFAQLFANRDLRNLYTERASLAIADAIDGDLAGLAATFSQVFGTYNTAITTDIVLNSIEQLDLNDVPETERYFVFRADVKRDLLDLAAYTSSDFVNGRPVETGSIGKLFGVDTFMSNNLVITGGTDRNNMLFHKQAICLAMAQAPRVQTDYLIKDLGTAVVVDTVYGFREMRDAFGVLVRT